MVYQRGVKGLLQQGAAAAEWGVTQGAVVGCACGMPMRRGGGCNQKLKAARDCRREGCRSRCCCSIPAI